MSFGESSWNDVGDFDLELVLVENDRIRKQSLLLIYYELSEVTSAVKTAIITPKKSEIWHVTV
jgi:hypothetical protein